MLNLLPKAGLKKVSIFRRGLLRKRGLTFFRGLKFLHKKLYFGAKCLEKGLNKEW